jgi:hypothetical protein
MKTSPVTPADLRSSVIAVPPLCRNADLTLNAAENKKLIEHMYAGGIRTLLYGGNANLYNIALSEYDTLLNMLQELAPEDPHVRHSHGSGCDPQRA